jgi:WD40 repeat protein
MRHFTFLLTFLLILTACAAPAKDLSQTTPSLEIEPTIAPVKPTIAPTETVTKATFEDSLLAVEWMGDAKGNVLFPLDPASGTALPGYESIPIGQGYSSAFSPDRRTLAVITFLNDRATKGNLLLIDLAAWKTRALELKPNGWASAMVFSPDGKRLAIADGLSTYRLTVFDLEKKVVTAQQEEDFLITRLRFTSDSKSLMLYGTVIDNRFTENEMSGGPPQVRLLDAADLTLLWSADLKAVRDGIFPTDEKVTPDLSQPGTAMYLSPGLVFEPEQNTLYVAHADSDQLSIVDFDAQKVETLEIQTELSWFERLLSLTADVAHAKVVDGTSKQVAVSPDGQLLYVVGMRSESVQSKNGNWEMKQIPLGLEIIRTSDGNRVERFETDASDLSLSTDGRFLYLRNWTDETPWTEVFDISTGQVLTHKEWIYATPALRMNGEPLLVSTYSTGEFSHHISIFQPDGSNRLAEWTSSNYVSWLTP